MLLVLLITTVICLAAWFYSRWLKVRGFWAERGVPYLPPHPVFGSLTFLQRLNPSTWMCQIYDQFQSPYVGIWLFWRPALNSPKIARNVLVTDSSNFTDRFVSSAAHDPFGCCTMFTSKDPLWSNIRRRISPMFTNSKLKSVQYLMSTKSKELVQRIAMESKK